jgi:hypothetical protein
MERIKAAVILGGTDAKNDALYMGWWDRFTDFFNVKAKALQETYDAFSALHALSKGNFTGIDDAGKHMDALRRALKPCARNESYLSIAPYQHSYQSWSFNVALHSRNSSVILFHGDPFGAESAEAFAKIQRENLMQGIKICVESTMPDTEANAMLQTFGWLCEAGNSKITGDQGMSSAFSKSHLISELANLPKAIASHSAEGAVKCTLHLERAQGSSAPRSLTVQVDKSPLIVVTEPDCLETAWNDACDLLIDNAATANWSIKDLPVIKASEMHNLA